MNPSDDSVIQDSSEADAVLATVLKVLPNAMFLLELEGGEQVRAHAAGKVRVLCTRLLAGDQVYVQCSPFDASKARITGLAQKID